MIKRYSLALVFMFCSFQLHAQSIQTFPTGFLSVKKAKEELPGYAEAIDQAQKLIGQVNAVNTIGTGYLYFNKTTKSWEAHTAFHVVKEYLDKSLPLVLDLPGLKGEIFLPVLESGVVLNNENLISSDNEHRQLDRARYKVILPHLAAPQNIDFSHHSVLEGATVLSLGFPSGIERVKVSLGHAIFKDKRNYWLNSATANDASSGSLVLTLGKNGQLNVLGTTVLAHNLSPFLLLSYEEEGELLPSLLGTIEYNVLAMMLSSKDTNVERLELQVRKFLSIALKKFFDQLENDANSPGIRFLIPYKEMIEQLKIFLTEAEKRAKLNPHNTALALNAAIKEYYSRNSPQSTLFNCIDFPLITQEQLNSTNRSDLQRFLQNEINQSIENLKVCSDRLDKIANLFHNQTLEHIIEGFQALELRNNEDNFQQYMIPMMSLLSPYGSN